MRNLVLILALFLPSLANANAGAVATLMASTAAVNASISANNAIHSSEDYMYRASNYNNYQNSYYGYGIKCDENGYKKQSYTSYSTVTYGYCKYLLKEICSYYPYKKNQQITNERLEEMSKFYDDGEEITSSKINTLCKHQIKTLK